MNDMTARLALPMIVPGQAQKELSHNEALALLDAAVQASVRAFNVVVPPTAPVEGHCWIVGDAPTGDWIGRARRLAVWTAGGWRFVQPTPGFRAWVVDPGIEAQFIDGAWVLGTLTADRLVLGGEAMLSTPAAAIADPTGGATIDVQARAAIAGALAVLRHHGLLRNS